MATKLDSKFEGFPLVDETFGDKFKKMFARKNSIVALLILVYCGINHAQIVSTQQEDGLSLDGPSATDAAPGVTTDPNAVTEIKPEATNPNEPIETKMIDVSEAEESKEEMYSENTLPFRYLNQYFIYEALDGSKVVLNEKEFNFSDIELVRENKTIQITLKGEWPNYLKKGRVALLGPDMKALSTNGFDIINGQFSVTDSISAKFICFQSKSRYSNLKVCKNMLPSDKTAVKSITANDSKLSAKGQIVVQDTTSKSQFKINYENLDTFYFETTRRKAYPAVINKAKDSEVLKVRFVDLDMPTLAWLDTLRIDQQFFEIKMDPLIQLRQDILFSDPYLKSKAFNKTLIQKKQVTIIAKNKFTFSPMIGYSQLVGDNPNLSVKLRTGMGTGASMQYSVNFQSRWEWYAQAHFLSTTILFEDTTKTLLGKNQSLYQVSGGALYHWKKNWDYTFGAGVRNDMFMQPVNTNQGAEVFSTLNKFVTIGLDYDLFTNKELELSIPLNLKFNLPGKIAGLTSYLGLQWEFGGMASYRLSWGRVFATAMYGSRQQNYGDFNFKEDYYYINSGLMYLF